MAGLGCVVGGGLRWRLIRAGLFLTFGLGFVAPTFGLVPPLAFRNDGPSMPEGYYLYAHAMPARRGEVVVLRDPPHFDLPWLMKRVEGVAGDLFCWRPDLGTDTLNGRPMPAPSPMAHRLGIPVWRGCRRLQAGEIVGYGRTVDSYDSRYFGPVEESGLWGIYRPIWVGP